MRMLLLDLNFFAVLDCVRDRACCFQSELTVLLSAGYALALPPELSILQYLMSATFIIKRYIQSRVPIMLQQ